MKSRNNTSFKNFDPISFDPLLYRLVSVKNFLCPIKRGANFLWFQMHGQILCVSFHILMTPAVIARAHLLLILIYRAHLHFIGIFCWKIGSLLHSCGSNKLQGTLSSRNLSLIFDLLYFKLCRLDPLFFLLACDSFNTHLVHHIG